MREAQSLVAIITAVNASDFDAAMVATDEIGCRTAVVGLAGIIIGMGEALIEHAEFDGLADLLSQLGLAAAEFPEL